MYQREEVFVKLKVHTSCTSDQLKVGVTEGGYFGKAMIISYGRQESGTLNNAPVLLRA